MTLSTYYHGTCEENAKALLQNGWQPRSGFQGSNMGNSNFLYLTSDPHDAQWFANEKECNTVLQVQIDEQFLDLDPEDAVYAYEYWSAKKKNNMEQSRSYFQKERELEGPTKVVTSLPIISAQFKMCTIEKNEWKCV